MVETSAVGIYVLTRQWARARLYLRDVIAVRARLAGVKFIH